MLLNRVVRYCLVLCIFLSNVPVRSASNLAESERLDQLLQMIEIQSVYIDYKQSVEMGAQLLRESQSLIDCREELQDISLAVERFYSTLNNTQKSENEKNRSYLKTRLESLINSKNKCAEAASLTYLVSLIQGTELTNREGNHRLQLLAVLLLQKKKLHFITSNQRQELAHKYNNSIWTKQRGDAYTMYGAYDCNGSNIYIDIGLSPFDVIATFVHELDHLFRDRLDDVKDEPLAEELTAAIRAAHFELNMARIKGSQTANLYGLSLSGPTLDLRYLDQMTLIKKNGSFFKSWQSFISDKMRLSLKENSFLEITFLELIDWLTQSAQSKLMENLTDKIKRVYGFKGHLQILRTDGTAVYVWESRMRVDSYGRGVGEEGDRKDLAQFILSLERPSHSCEPIKKPIKPGDAGVRPTLKPCLRTL